MTYPRTLLDKVWDAHRRFPGPADTPAVLYVDLHLVHEVTSPQAFSLLRERGLTVRRPDRTLATMDHAIPTAPAPRPGAPPRRARRPGRSAELERNCRDFGIPLYAAGQRAAGHRARDRPRAGRRPTPGMTIVCGDSHTSTHGAFGALAFGIGTSEVGHVLATQSLLQSKPKIVCPGGGRPAARGGDGEGPDPRAHRDASAPGRRPATPSSTAVARSGRSPWKSA